MAAGKVQQDVWSAFSRKKAQNLVVELVLPSLRFAPRRSVGLEPNAPDLWPTPSSADDEGVIDRTFREVTDGLRSLGVRDVVELRNAGSLVVRLNEDQVSRLAEWPSIRRIYANTSL